EGDGRPAPRRDGSVEDAVRREAHDLRRLQGDRRALTPARRPARWRSARDGIRIRAPLASGIDMAASHGTAALPATFDAQLATLVKTAPEGDAWLHEMKFDGYRIAARVDRGRVA